MRHEFESIPVMLTEYFPEDEKPQVIDGALWAHSSNHLRAWFDWLFPEKVIEPK